jgi:argininosuccinate lyase
MKLSETYDTIVLNRTYGNFRQYLKNEFDLVNKAHLVMLSRTGILHSETVHTIKEGLVRYGQLTEFPERKPEDVEDYFFYAEQKLSEYVGDATAGSLHLARSRNDLDTTLFRMVMRDNIVTWVSRIVRLLEGMLQRCRETEFTPVVLYTHGQPAQISSFAHYLGAMISEILETLSLSCDAYSFVNKCPMGACAITTTGFPIDRALVSTLLGFIEPVANSYQAISTSHWLLIPVQNWILFLNDLTRFIEDMIHKSSYEVGILSYPDDLVQISSIMPQKRNPVILEHIRIKAGIVLGVFQSFFNVFHNTGYQDINENGDRTLEALQKAFFEMLETVDLFEEAVLKCTVDTQRVNEIANKSGITVTELADEIVREEKIDFRSAHTIVSRFIKEGSSYESLKQAFYEKTGKVLSLSENRIREILTPDHFLRIRKVYGGPGAMNAFFLRISGEIELLRKRASEDYNRLCWSRNNLLEAFNQL